MFIHDHRAHKTGLEGFRKMRDRLEAAGMDRNEAEAWASMAVSGFNIAITRGDTLTNAADYFFGPVMAAEYLAAAGSLAEGVRA